MTNQASPVRLVSFRVRPLLAPLTHPHKTASGTLHAAPLVLLDIGTDVGVTGSAYVFAYTPMALEPLAALLRNVCETLPGERLDIPSLWSALAARFRLLGNQGLVAMALSAVDMALWDVEAKLKGQPLCRLLGAEPDPIPVYDSLGQMPPDETAREVEASLKRGFRAFKIKAGHEDPDVDAAVVRAIRKVAGAETWVAADFNQAFSVDEAIARMRRLDEEQLAWIEEPVAATDHAGHAAVREAVSTPVQTGENWWGCADMENAVAAGASDLVMPDVMKIGGVSGWRRASDIAATHGLPVASHLFIEISSHLMAATPMAHILEWFDIAGSIIGETPQVADGKVVPLNRPGCGICWDEAAISRIAG